MKPVIAIVVVLAGLYCGWTLDPKLSGPKKSDCDSPEFSVLRNYSKSSGASECFLRCYSQDKGTDWYCSAAIYFGSAYSRGHGESMLIAIQGAINMAPEIKNKPRDKDIKCSWSRGI